MYCEKCRKPKAANDKYCDDCGSKLVHQSTVQSSTAGLNVAEVVKEKKNGGGFFGPEKHGISKGVAGGAVMMSIAAIWFFVGLGLGWVFFYPPILFAFGAYAFIKGLVTHNLSGVKN